MTTPLIAKLAVRTLGRNVRRTFLSVLGIGIGCAIAIFMTALTRGSDEMRVRSIAESGYGHVRITPEGWERTRDDDLRLADWRRALDLARSDENVTIAAPHARTTALLSFGTQVAGMQMLGVDPQTEFELSRIARAIGEGRYLEEGDRDLVVVGAGVTDRLDVELDDDLLLTVVDSTGQMKYAMLRIVGVIRTGVEDIDDNVCHVTLGEMERLTGREGAAEITLMLRDHDLLDETAAALQSELPDGYDVLTWKEILPEQGGDTESDKAFMALLSGIVVVVVVLGIAGAQLTAVLERKREFAVLIALGMKGRQIISLMVLEAVAMGVLGGALGLLLSTPLVHYTSTTGIDIYALMGGEFSFSGVLFEPIMYSDMGPWMVPHAFAIALIAMLISAVYPSVYALRTDPTSALSLREA
jgi:ABC-type lipoprotein release transport system permease subunit